MTQENPSTLDYQGYSTLPKASQFRPRGDRLGIYLEALHEAVEPTCVELTECVGWLRRRTRFDPFAKHPSFFWLPYQPQPREPKWRWSGFVIVTTRGLRMAWHAEG
jgi:hypothetical protein